MSCDGCKFAHPDPEKPDIYECRLNPPLIVGTGHGVSQQWPLVHALEWCGQEQPREPAPKPPSVETRRYLDEGFDTR